MSDPAPTFIPTDLVAAAVSSCRGKRALAIVELVNLEQLESHIGFNGTQEIIQTFQRHVNVLLRPQDSLIEISSERVAVVLDDLIDFHHLQLAGMKLERIFDAPLELGDTCIEFDVRGGFVFLARSNFPTDEIADLLARAESSLNVAKGAQAEAAYHISTLEDEARVENHWQIGMRLRDALHAHHIYMDYQPKIDLRNGALAGAEALVRWRDKGTILPPIDYLPALTPELMWELTVYIFRRVLHDIMDYQIDIPVAINFDPVTISEPELVPLLRRETSLWGIEPEKIVLEITEVSELLNMSNATQCLTEIREMGFKVSIDDFGSGHSNMERLRNLPMDELKIDRSFIANITRDEQNATITKSIIDLSKQLGFQTVAEGIEDAETLEVLAAWGCDFGQGYYLGAPLPIESLKKLTD